jgi:hypothetical protein
MPSSVFGERVNVHLAGAEKLQKNYSSSSARLVKTQQNEVLSYALLVELPPIPVRNTTKAFTACWALLSFQGTPSWSRNVKSEMRDPSIEKSFHERCVAQTKPTLRFALNAVKPAFGSDVLVWHPIARASDKGATDIQRDVAPRWEKIYRGVPPLSPWCSRTFSAPMRKPALVDDARQVVVGFSHGCALD